MERFMSKENAFGINQFLENLVKIGIMSIKTIKCSMTKNEKLQQICPTCNPAIVQMSESMPLIMRNISRIKCEHCSLCINDQNPGYVISKNKVICKRSIEELRDKNGLIYNPYKPNEKVYEKDIKKLFFS